MSLHAGLSFCTVISEKEWTKPVLIVPFWHDGVSWISIGTGFFIYKLEMVKYYFSFSIPIPKLELSRLAGTEYRSNTSALKKYVGYKCIFITAVQHLEKY